MAYVELALRGMLNASSLVVNDGSMILYETLTPGFVMLMSPNQNATAVYGCDYQGDLVVRMRKVMAIPRG